MFNLLSADWTKVIACIESDITSEAKFLEKYPSHYMCETPLDKWLSSTPAGSPGKGELYFSSKAAGNLPKNEELLKTYLNVRFNSAGFRPCRCNGRLWHWAERSKGGGGVGDLWAPTPSPEKSWAGLAGRTRAQGASLCRRDAVLAEPSLRMHQRALYRDRGSTPNLIL